MVFSFKHMGRSIGNLSKILVLGGGLAISGCSDTLSEKEQKILWEGETQYGNASYIIDRDMIFRGNNDAYIKVDEFNGNQVTLYSQGSKNLNKVECTNTNNGLTLTLNSRGNVELKRGEDSILRDLSSTGMQLDLVSRLREENWSYYDTMYNEISRKVSDEVSKSVNPK